MSAPWLPALAELLEQRVGLHFPPERWGELAREVRSVARAHELPEEVFARGLCAGAAAQLDALVEALTIGETYFFREPHCLEALARHVLPALVRNAGGRPLRLWSAGCATGEEAYSLAIVLERVLPPHAMATVLASDVNASFLRAAARAEFGPWAFRGTPPGLREAYFTRSGRERWTVLPQLRRRVTFARLNLAEDTYPRWDNGTAAVDVILCRNVLMYFHPAQARRVVRRLHAALAPGGWLAVGAVEASVRLFDALAAVRFDGALLYHDMRGATEPPAPVAALPAEPAPAPAPACVPPGRVGTGAAESPLAFARREADAGRLSTARAAVERALGAAKLDAVAHHLHAMILLEQGHDALGRAALQRALYLEPGFVLAHHALGQLAWRSGRRAEARRHFRNALALLAPLDAATPVPHSDGIAAGQLRALIEAALAAQEAA
jgi:chemotaxis protein methyltransferase CheR